MKTKKKTDPVIHYVGDSHVSFMRGTVDLAPLWPERGPSYIPGIVVQRAGPFLAYSLTRPRHKARQVLRAIASSFAPDDAVVLSYGEIDCRWQVVHQARLQRRTIRSVARELAKLYVPAARKLIAQARLAFADAGPAQLDHIQTEGGFRGSVDERREAVIEFNAALKREASRVGCPVLEIHDKLCDGKLPDRRWFMDSVHLGRQAAPLMVEELIRVGWIADVSAARATARALADLPGPPPPPAMEPTSNELDALLDRAALECVARGARRVALFGAGAHTRRVGFDFLRARGLEVVGVLDDASPDTNISGVPVLRPDRCTLSIDAVVISSDTIEPRLSVRAHEVFAPRGIPIVRIYQWKSATPQAITPAQAHRATKRAA
ncbi:MAG: hypothetical protein SFY96_09020 [Planctomycetota bacterium]|nr:hypothetical protein [Planctomycetota bacterium]